MPWSNVRKPERLLDSNLISDLDWPVLDSACPKLGSNTAVSWVSGTTK